MVSDIHFLPYLVLLVSSIYFSIIYVSISYFRVESLFCNFEASHKCFFGDKFQGLLLFTRSLSLIYFLGIVTIYHDIIFPSDWWFFTFWNIYLLSTYFLLSTVSTLLDFCCRGFEETLFGKKLGKVIVSLYSVCGATAFFITVINFSLLSPSLNFWNISEHMVTTIAILIEISLNAFQVQPIQYIFCASWIMLYVGFIWIIHLSGLKDWPYWFLDADNWTSLLWYSGLFVLDVVFFTIWWSIHKVKAIVADYINNKPSTRPSSDDFESLLIELPAYSASKADPLPLMTVLPKPAKVYNIYDYCRQKLNTSQGIEGV